MSDRDPLLELRDLVRLRMENKKLRKLMGKALRLGLAKNCDRCGMRNKCLTSYRQRYDWSYCMLREQVVEGAHELGIEVE